jgi:hypothetical protein
MSEVPMLGLGSGLPLLARADRSASGYLVRTVPPATTLQKCEAVPRRARISGAWIVVSLNSMLESNQKAENRYLQPSEPD